MRVKLSELLLLVVLAMATGSVAAGDEGPISPAVLVRRDASPEAFPLATVGGRLVRRGPCVLLDRNGRHDLVIWRADTRIITLQHGTFIQFRNGSTVGPIGTYVSLVGGGAPGAVLDQISLNGFQPQCATEDVVFASGPA